MPLPQIIPPPNPIEPNYIIPENPAYTEQIPRLYNESRANASLVLNPIVQRLIDNIHALKLRIDALEGAGVGGECNCAASPPDYDTIEGFLNLILSLKGELQP